MRSNRHWVSFLMFICLIVSSCDAQPQRELFNVLIGKDHQGPILLESMAVDAHTARYRFDEFVRCNIDDVACLTGENTIIRVETFEEMLTVSFSKPLYPGKRLPINARVSDMVGNTLSFTIGVWGFNGCIPNIVINEFVTKGSPANPDRVELLVLSNGNLAGVTFYDGLPDSFDSEVILPSRDVHAGDRIVIEYGPSLRGVHAIEYWGGEIGLGANNGVLGLCASPEGRVIDAVLYSNRTSSSDTQYGGFGTKKVQLRAALLEDTGLWGPLPTTPETGIESSYGTATRSHCRTPGDPDTDSKQDWHVVPTGQASFGAVNVTDQFAP